eukprot:1802090-Pyramimonas_sp.AAC.1
MELFQGKGKGTGRAQTTLGKANGAPTRPGPATSNPGSDALVAAHNAPNHMTPHLDPRKASFP